MQRVRGAARTAAGWAWRIRLHALWPLLGLVSACTGLAPVALPQALTGLHTTLEDEADRYTLDGAEYWRWKTYWVVRWDPVPGAVAYELVYMTSEGASKKTSRLDQPPYRLEVAKGDNAQYEGMPTRAMQLLTIQGLLAVKILPRLADGSTGTSSTWLQVGRSYP